MLLSYYYRNKIMSKGGRDADRITSVPNRWTTWFGAKSVATYFNLNYS